MVASRCCEKYTLYMLKHVRLFTIQNKRKISHFPRSKWASEYNNNKVSNYICTQICINVKVVFLRITSENLRTLTEFMKKYSSYIIFTESNKKVRNIFTKGTHLYWKTFYLRRASSLVASRNMILFRQGQTDTVC